jgi:hypothetical protein
VNQYVGGNWLIHLNRLEVIIMKYVYHPDFLVSIRTLRNYGGKYQKSASIVEQIHSRIDFGDDNPFHGISLTKHSEQRIKNCLKYDLPGFCRLITICTNGITALCFVGKHDDSEKWLNRNKGLTLTADKDKRISKVFISSDIGNRDTRIQTITDYSVDKLYKKLPERYFNRIADEVSRSLIRKFEDMESIATEEDILELAYEINEKEKQDLFFDVFTLLKEGKVVDAKNRIDVYTNNSIPLEDLSNDEIKQLVEGDDFIDADGVGELLNHFIKTADYKSWMLFLGKEQKEVINKDFNGPAKLSGISGSGKTCVVIKRAIRLADKYHPEKILVLTLNKSLSKLISQLTDYACPERLRGNIVVKSFWEMCQEELKKYEPDNFEKLYNDVTWKHNEHISEIWDEYYDIWLQRRENNFDASKMIPIHMSLLSRGIYPKEYIRQEFDWVRTAFNKERRDEYFKIEREGRAIPFLEDQRDLILKGLTGWEDKMSLVGVTDYVGLALALHRHIDKMKPLYRCILIDEVQDFGTIELDIIRKLAQEDENDIFLSGDIVQKVSTKHTKMKSAGIDVSNRSVVIRRNYRNSKEILSAAYDVLNNNINVEVFKNEDFEILDPEYAYLSMPKPLALKANSISEEFTYCYQYLHDKYVVAGSNQKACIVLCGYTFVDIKSIGAKLNIPVLDGSSSLESGTIFLSDLEQTKGFEFDTMCILHCNQDVIPDPSLPREEWYRELSKFYVAMTRAKLELIISYSYTLSNFIQNSREYFSFYDWKEHIEDTDLKIIELPKPKRALPKKRVLKMTGNDFIYTREAIGCSVPLQEKLVKAIRGVNRAEAGNKQYEWENIQKLIETPKPDMYSVIRIFGKEGYTELQNVLRNNGVIE